MNTKAELLAKYASKEPVRFIQIDGFAPEQCDDVIGDCGDGYGLMTGAVEELMSGVPVVRVLVKPGTDPLLVDKILKGAMSAYPSLCCNYPSDGEKKKLIEDVCAYVRMLGEADGQRQLNAVLELLRASTDDVPF